MSAGPLCIKPAPFTGLYKFYDRQSVDDVEVDDIIDNEYYDDDTFDYLVGLEIDVLGRWLSTKLPLKTVEEIIVRYRDNSKFPYRLYNRFFFIWTFDQMHIFQLQCHG